MSDSIITKCEKIIRDISNDIAQQVTPEKPFAETVIKKMGFQNTSDWSRLCSVMDLLSDTELAKENFLKFSLSGPTKYKDLGEQYLRLYGVTNAIYLQKTAIITFVELVKLPSKKAKIQDLNSVQIIKFRNIVGAHTVDYIDAGTTNPHQFQRFFLDDGPITVIDSQNKFEDYNLKEMISDYDSVAETVLLLSIEKFISTALKNGGQKKEMYLKKLTALRLASVEGFSIWPDANEELFIIKVRD